MSSGMNLLQKNWLVKRISEDALSGALREYAKGRLIDVGCADKPYEKLTRGLVASHVGLDHENTQHDRSRVDVFGTAYCIPMEDGTFETVLCTAVLEHLEEPAEAIGEMFRVLAGGGHLIMTVPFFWHLHEEPRDFYRYTNHGLRYLLEKNGFEIVELLPLSGFCVTFGQELVYFLWQLRRGGRLNPLWWIIPPLGALIQSGCYVLNKIDRSTIFTWAYLVVGRKPCGL